MQTDRELLELAAKAGGIKIIRSRLDDPMHKDMLAQNSARNFHHENGPWNPLTDDGDALRLAVALEMSVHCDGDVAWVVEGVTESPCFQERTGRDAPAATRRAIVRAAAAMAVQGALASA